MARIFIAEFWRSGILGSAAPVPGQPPEIEQAFDFGTSGNDQSAAFTSKTNMVRIFTDVDCRIAFGENPTATADSQPHVANSDRFHGVVPGHKLAVRTP